MKLIVRKHGSQRTSNPVKLTLCPNFTGQGGEPVLTFQTEDGRYLRVFPESSDDMVALLSAVHIVHHNYQPKKPRSS